MNGYFFVSGENNYVTCGSGSAFEWSHQRVNKTARIPACTSKIKTFKRTHTEFGTK